MKHQSQKQKKGVFGSAAMMGAGLLFASLGAIPERAEAGEAEVAAGLLLGAALVIAVDNDSHSHRRPAVGHVRPYDSHRWYDRGGRRYCGSHASYHVNVHVDSRDSHHHKKSWGHDNGHHKGWKHSKHHDRYVDNDRHHRNGYRGYNDKWDRHGDRDRGRYAEARWNTRVKAY